MRRAERLANPGDTWRTLFDEQRSTLLNVAEVLLDRGISSQQILDQAMLALAGSPVPEAFVSVAAIRAVVKAALAQNREAAASRSESESQDAAKDGASGGLLMEMLPWPERAVYFLRQILRYSRRDTALLLGMSDTNIDQIQRLAERRMSHSSSASTEHIFQDEFQLLL